MGEVPRPEEQDIYMDNLAGEIKEAPKGDRKEILNVAKENPEYWESRNKKLSKKQEEVPINDGLGVFLKKKTLYHGSSTSGIEEFKAAEETTVGEGLYCTSQAKDAINYSHQRSGGPEKEPILYEVLVENLKLLDLRNNENIKSVMRDYAPIIRGKIDRMKEEILKIRQERKDVQDDLKVMVLGDSRQDLITAYGLINSEEINIHTIQEVTRVAGQLFTDYVRSIGYDGLITIEGGEGDFRKSNHDSYVLFDPEMAKIVKEQKLAKKAKK